MISRRSLRLLASDGENVFRDGVVGRAIVTEVARRGGLLTLDDMRRYRAPMARADRQRVPRPSRGELPATFFRRGRPGPGPECSRGIRSFEPGGRRCGRRASRDGGHEARFRGSSGIHGGFGFRRRTDRDARLQWLRGAPARSDRSREGDTDRGPGLARRRFGNDTSLRHGWRRWCRGADHDHQHAVRLRDHGAGHGCGPE